MNMNLPFTEDILVKDAVTAFPKASDIFKKHRIDFCCGGNISIKTAAQERGINTEEIMQKLKEIFEGENNLKLKATDWTMVDSADIIGQIIEKFHKPTIDEFKQLSPYVTKVAKVHGDRHPELLKIRDLFFTLKEEMLEHMQKEEEIVFSLIQEHQTSDKIIGLAIEELENEHHKSGDILKEIRDLSQDFTPPLDACGTFRLVFNRLEALEDTTFQHIHLENHILFPRYSTN